ncbi:MAG TPA: lactate utilization protein C [Herpetosiphonaceae bacterium]
MSARDEILQRVRNALRDVPQHEQPADIVVERAYRATDDAPHEQLIEQFVERVTEYKATVRRVASSALPAAIAESCAARGVRRLLVPRDLPAEWLPADVEPVLDHNLSYAEIDSSDGVLTGCALGIAQTGTIVLDGGPRQGRRVLTLLPDYHLCVVFEDQIVGLVPEAVARLDDAVREQHRALTWISGPSATSDIELNRVEGVHGPRTLEVIVVVEEQENQGTKEQSSTENSPSPIAMGEGAGG